MVETTNTTIAIREELKSLPAPIKIINEALYSPMVKNASSTEIFYKVNAAVAKSFADTGFKLPGDDDQEVEREINYLINEIISWAKVNLPSLRIEEIPIAFSRGIRKEFGDYMGLSVVTFQNFLDGYAKSEERRLALVAKNTPKEETTPKPTLEEQFQTAKYNTMQALEAIKAGKSIDLTGWMVYDFLYRINLIQYDEEDREAFKQEAKAKLIAESASKNTIETDRSKFNHNNMIIDIIQKGLANATVETMIKSKAKSLALTSYFKQEVLMNELDLGKMIDEKKSVFISINQKN